MNENLPFLLDTQSTLTEKGPCSTVIFSPPSPSFTCTSISGIFVEVLFYNASSVAFYYALIGNNNLKQKNKKKRKKRIKNKEIKEQTKECNQYDLNE